MAQANREVITPRPTRLSSLFENPALRTAFRRAEGSGVVFVVPPPRPLVLAGGAAALNGEGGGNG
jgi:hypothetical protein